MLLALMLLVVFAGRVADMDATVRRAASEAARAASLQRQASEAVDAAQTTAAQNLREAGVTCTDQSTDVEVGDLRAGGTVTVTVRCLASMRDVAFIGVPGSRTFEARSVEIVDTYRSDPP